MSRMIKELIAGHDRVSLPGIGSFVAEDIPASFSDRGFTINPPYKRLSFRMYRENDGLLAALYASGNRISPEKADGIICDYAARLREKLETDKLVVFPGLGKLRATRQNEFFFVPDADVNISPEELGLKPISLKSHAEPAPEPVTEAPDPVTVAPDPVAAVPGPVAGLPEAAGEVRAESAVPAAESRQVEPVRRSVFLRVLTVILLVALVLAAAFFACAKLAPELLDRLLYTAEELEIIYAK